MDGPRLSPRERRVLAEMEEDLRKNVLARDPRKPHRGRRLPVPRARGERRRPSGVVLAVLATAALVLLILGIVTERAGFIWAFTAVWVLTLIWLLRLVIHWTRRLQERRSGAEGPRGGGGHEDGRSGDGPAGV
ncbi:DUF3040 domain-containing protein [Streptomyces sp. NPDC048577]